MKFAGAVPVSCALAMLAGCRARDQRPLVVILVPSQDNPFFKAEADAAAARAAELGYRVRVDAHNDDAYRQDNLVDAAIASDAAILILDNAGADSSVSAVRRAAKASDCRLRRFNDGAAYKKITA